VAKENPMIQLTPGALDNRLHVAYSYARFSHGSQNEVSIKSQNDRCHAYYTAILEPKEVIWGQAFADDGVSAFSIPLEQRPGGKEFLQTIKDGDHVIFDHPDRLARKAEEFHKWLSWFDKHDIKYHFLNPLVDGSTAAGKLLLGIMAIVAEWESRRKSEKSKDRVKYARKHGKPVGPPRKGCKIIRRKGERWEVWDENARAIMAEIVRLREEEKLTWDAISIQIDKHLNEVNRWGHPAKYDTAFYKRHWSDQKVRRAYFIERYYQDNDIKEPIDIPEKIGTQAHAHAQKHGLMEIHPRRKPPEYGQYARSL
jgi:DNA invertase Pin-like site-specific DNA recombinase